MQPAEDHHAAVGRMCNCIWPKGALGPARSAGIIANTEFVRAFAVPATRDLPRYGEFDLWLVVQRTTFDKAISSSITDNKWNLVSSPRSRTNEILNCTWGGRSQAIRDSFGEKTINGENVDTFRRPGLCTGSLRIFRELQVAARERERLQSLTRRWQCNFAKSWRACFVFSYLLTGNVAASRFRCVCAEIAISSEQNFPRPKSLNRSLLIDRSLIFR